MALNRLDDAEKCVLESKEIRTKINDLKGISSCYGNLAILEEKRNNLLKAKDYGQKGLSIAIEIQSKPEIFHAYEILSTIESKLGNHKDAYEYLALSTLYKDTLINESNIKAVNEVEARFQNEKKQKELNEINAELDRQQLIKNAVFAGLLLSLIVFILIILFIRAKQKTAQILQIQKERERIARDLHDNIGSHLTYIIHGIEDAAEFYPNVKVKDLENLAKFSRETISQLRQTIWAMNTDHIQADELMNKIKDMAVQYLNFPEAPKLDIKCKGDLSKITFSPNKAINILRITQEAIQNIMKHAKANHVHIEAIEQFKKFTISIKDDGIGFKNQQSPENHYGLDNMFKRAQENDFLFLINSTIGSGTEIIISQTGS
jgi:signal transduction histidine kinase